MFINEFGDNSNLWIGYDISEIVCPSIEEFHPDSMGWNFKPYPQLSSSVGHSGELWM